MMNLTDSQFNYNSYSKKEIFLICLGGLFCLVGLILNEFFLSPLLSPTGSFQSLGVRLAIWTTNILLVGWGAATILFRKREFIMNLNLAMISLIIITPFITEVFIRSAIALNVDFFRDPRLYAGWLDDDDQWKLRHLWSPDNGLQEAGFVWHPTLGWAVGPSAENPLGVLAADPYTPDFEAKTVLFYGDSFVYGTQAVPVNKRIPQQLDDLLPDYQVYNYAVSGYGLDQIYLRFRETHTDFQKPFIIIGIMTLDLDRSILSVRDAPKPYFEIVDDDLVLRGAPLPENKEGWYEQHPPELRSYLAAWLFRRYVTVAGGFRESELLYKRTEKQIVNAKIIEAIVAEARSRDLPLLFVIFYPQWEFNYDGWREQFLKEQFARLEVPYIDTKALAQKAVENQQAAESQQGAEESLDISVFYNPPPDSHPSELGNKVVAEAIADYFKQDR